MNTQLLLEGIKINEKAKDFFFATYFTGEGCGTYGCFVGNHWLARNPGEFHRKWSGVDEFINNDAYGLTFFEFDWLFVPGGDCCNLFGFHVRDGDAPREEVIARVRKFIYWKLHNADMMTGGTAIYEQARAIAGMKPRAQK